MEYVSQFCAALSCKYSGMHSYMIFQWSKGIVPYSIKYGGKLFMEDGGQIILGKFIGTLFYMQSYWLDHDKGRGVSQMHFPVI